MLEKIKEEEIKRLSVKGNFGFKPSLIRSNLRFNVIIIVPYLNCMDDADTMGIK